MRIPRIDMAVRNDLDRKELANLAGMAAVHDDGILGLTISRYALRALTHSTYTHTDDHVCLWVERIEAALSIPEMVVYVAREYAPGSCQYDAVMEHEREHVRITGGLLQPFARRVEADLKARMAAAMPLTATTLADAEIAARRHLESAMAALIGELEAERISANAHLDTEDSYRHTAGRCSDW